MTSLSVLAPTTLIIGRIRSTTSFFSSRNSSKRGRNRLSKTCKMRLLASKRLLQTCKMQLFVNNRYLHVCKTQLFTNNHYLHACKMRLFANNRCLQVCKSLLLANNRILHVCGKPARYHFVKVTLRNCTFFPSLCKPMCPAFTLLVPVFW